MIVSRIDQQDIFGTGVMIEVSTTFDKPVHLVLNMIPPRVKEAEVLKFARIIGAPLHSGHGWMASLLRRSDRLS